MRIGIDPGITGALVLIYTTTNDVCAWADMPVMVNGKKQQINPAELAKIIRGWQNDLDIAHNTTVYLEQVSAMPGQGVSSMFGFGCSFGIIQGVVAALGLPLVMVTPQKWKRAAGLIGKDKDAARTLAQRLYPELPLARKKDIGRADAVLIARYG